MEYRLNKKTGDRISVIGPGTSYIGETSEKEAVEALLLAHENGINYADLATAGAETFAYYGTAFSDLRKDMLYQVHFGANYETGPCRRRGTMGFWAHSSPRTRWETVSTAIIASPVPQA